MTWPAVVIWILVFASMMSRGPMILYVSAIAGTMQTLQMIPGEIVGGTNFLPASVCSVFLVIKILMRRDLRSMLDAALDPRKLGLLFAFYIWCLFSAYVMPRLFQGQVDVVPIAVTLPWAIPLEPTAANITQPAYLTISIMSALAGYFAASQPSFIRHWLLATVVGGFALIGTGILDFVLTAAGQSALLEAFRNSTHNVLADNQIGGAQRVIGLMDEASVYGSSCVATLSALAFLRPCFEPLWRDKIVPLTIFALIGFALLSTSSAAYVGLVVFGFAYAINWARRSRSNDPAVRSGLSIEATLAIAGMIGLLVIVTFSPNLLNPVIDFLNPILFEKSASSSYEDRTMMTRVGLEAFFATYGLGVGFGGARTSNWFICELCNTGLFGSILLSLFFAQVLGLSGRRGKRGLEEFVIGLRFSTLPNLAIAALIGTTPDVAGTFGFGMIAAATPSEGHIQPNTVKSPQRLEPHGGRSTL